jgi:hypothetical protein
VTSQSAAAFLLTLGPPKENPRNLVSFDDAGLVVRAAWTIRRDWMVLPERVLEEDYFQVSLDGRLAAGGTSSCQVRLLGPVQGIRAGREIGLGGRRPRAVLAVLALEAGRVVPVGRLVEEVWRSSPTQFPRTARRQAAIGSCGGRKATACLGGYLAEQVVVGASSWAALPEHRACMPALEVQRHT